MGDGIHPGRYRSIPVHCGGIRASLLMQAVKNFLASYSLPDPQQRSVAGAGQTVRRAYLRAAQAYMLISMPTGTSTIFGVFQLIRFLPSSAGTTFVPASKLG